jgi:RNA 3'-terminal phosphate cyclase (ATP)
VAVTVQPQARLTPIEVVDRGRVVRRRIRGIVSRLPRHIAEREVGTALRELDWPGDCGSVEEVDSPGPGNAVVIEVYCEHVAEVFTGFGQRGVRAENVASAAAREARRYLEASVPVGEHLADQLLLPMALAGGGRFRTLAPTLHTSTNIATLARFLETKIGVSEVEPGVWEIRAGT